MDDPEWIIIEEAIALHADQLAEHGGADGIRDLNLLASAIGRPRHLFAYDDPTPDVPALAAAYAVAIAKNHASIDGNKRAALAVSLTFLDRNGFEMTAALDDRFEKFLALAAGEIEEDAFASWLKKNVRRIEG